MGERVKNENVIDVEDVRHFIFDRSATDNPLLLDLEFSDDEINRAMKYCAMSYNDQAPYVNTIQATSLPNEIYLIKGVIYHLYLSKLQQLRRNEVAYAAGNAVVEIDAKRIEFYEKWIPFFKDEFETGVMHAKQYANWLQGFRAH